MGSKFEFERESENLARITVVGVGGAGGNAINRMIEEALTGVDFLAVNTDAQALKTSKASSRIQVGSKLTKGLGSGGNPEVGRRSIEEDEALVIDSLRNSDMVFVTAGMGGGTGTGGAPLVARIARELGALTVGIVTRPFEFEGRRRNLQAVEGMKALKEAVDTLIVIPNQKLLHVVGADTPLTAAFSIADDVLLKATRGISDLITVPGLVNLDFADVKTIMANMGDALMGTGYAEGPDRARLATQQAISSPLLDDVDIAGARGVLVNITGGLNMTLHEVSEATTLVQKTVGDDANIIFGAVVDETIDTEIRVTVIATGFGGERISMPAGRDVTVRHEPVRPAAQVASITPLAARPERRAEPVPAMTSAVPAAAPVSRAAVSAPTARVEAPSLTSPSPTVAAAAASPSSLPRGAAAPWLDLDLDLDLGELADPGSEPREDVVEEPGANARVAEARHKNLPRPGLPSWSADDLDVPAFLRRQMD